MGIEVLVIEPGGELYAQTLDTTLSGIQKLVGGWIECPPSDDDRVSLFINEEGKLIGLEPNFYGTAVWHAVMPAARGNDLLCGTVVVTGGVDRNGNTTSLAPEMHDAIVRALSKLDVVLG